MSFCGIEPRLKNSEGVEMENLKKLLGSAYKEGITVEEINTFLGSGKFVNLNDGNYVDKDKYNKVVAERDGLKTNLDELKESTKDYDTLKAENETFKGEKADAELKAKLIKLGVNEKAFKYVKGDINDKSLVLGDDEKANKDAIAKYLKENPQFAGEKSSDIHTRVITTKIDNKPGDVVVDNKTINDNFRNALGKKVNVE